MQKDGASYFIDKAEKKPFEPKFDSAEPFSGGVALIGVQNKVGYINTKGETVVAPTFEYARSFKGGLAVAIQDGKVGFINLKGEFVIKPQFENAEDFSNGLALVMMGANYGYVNAQGKVVWQRSPSELPILESAANLENSREPAAP